MVSAKKERRRGNRGDKAGGDKAGGDKAASSDPSAPSSAPSSSGPSSSSNSKQPSLLLPEDGIWYTHMRSAKGRDAHSASATAPGALVRQFRELADEQYAKDLERFRAANPKDSWVEKAASKASGATLSDRIASMVLLISAQPVYRLSTFDALLNLASTESRVIQLIANAVSDLLKSNLLPPERALVDLAHRPLQQHTDPRNPLSPKVLILWRFEELLRARYQTFLNLCAGWLAAPLALTKQVSLNTCAALLISIPEGEATLLTMIANKLGDPEPKTAASAAHSLRRVLKEHPAMALTVAREVQQLAYRPNLGSQSVYNCITFLNQMQFTRGDQDLPVMLCGTYFKLFEYASRRDEKPSKKDKKGKGKGKAAAAPSAAIKAKLLSALLTGVNRAHPYLPPGHLSSSSHADSLYRISHEDNAALAVSSLMLLFNLVVTDEPKAGPATDRYYRALYSLLANPAAYLGSSLSLFYNLLFKAVKADPVPSRALAVLKRLLAESMHVPSGNAAGGALFLASHVAAAPKRKHLLEALVGDGSAGEADFDTSQRDPLYAVGGESKDAGTSIWETAMLQNHWHPSVSKFAANLMGDGTIDYTGDPLRDFTLAPFLDRLAYKNPKSKEKLKKDFRLGESVAERKSGGRGLAVAGGVAVNDPLYLQQHAPVGEEFFYRFFSAKAEADAKSGKKDVKDVDLEDAEIDQFGDVDTNWDADDSEEEFAQKVAEDMMERHGNGKAHFDDEDVAFDMSSDDDDSVGEGGGEGGGEGESDDDEFGDGPVGEEASSDDDEEEEEDDDSDDEDAKMLMEDSEDDEVSSDGMEQGGSAFADAPSSSDEEEPVEAEDDSDSDEDDDDDDDMGEFPLDSDSEDEAPVKKKGKKGKSDEPTFASSADAFQTDDYWAQRDKEMAAKEKRMLDAIGGPEPSNSGGKKRKSRRKSQKQ